MAGLLTAAPAVAFAAPQPSVSEIVKAEAPAPAQKSDSTGYAAREAQDKKVADYEGGASSVVIVMSGGALVVLLFLLLIL